MSKNPMTKEDSSRIQSSQTKNHRDVGPGSFAARAQSAADSRANTQGSQGNQSTQGAQNQSNTGSNK